ncbi:unnamed protein product [Nezara viridula]|uniref:Uncharacterized protein n=1 Tax=Nezara viridula TaxID=85310 RepID=A0A9P0HHZ9_NEZVI|nr:unnamed protein product [Nezara viridula]
MTDSKLREIDPGKNPKKPNPVKNDDEDSDLLEEEEQRSEHTSELMNKSSNESSSSVLTETLSPWRAAAYLHIQTCRAKFIKEFGKDIHLHSDDSDTMIKLKEKITPSCAQIADKERLRKKHKKVSKSIPTPFDEWLNKKNKELKHQKMQAYKQREIKELKEAAEEAKKAKKRSDKAEKWRKNRQHLDNEKKAIAKIKARDRPEKQYLTDLSSNVIPATEWEKIRQAAEDMKHIEPLKLGRLEGQGNKDPGKYLTKYVVQPDPAFRARYKHILEAEEARPTEIILDGDHKGDAEDPAGLPRQFKQMLREEASTLKEYLTAGNSYKKELKKMEVNERSYKRIVKGKLKSKILVKKHSSRFTRSSSIPSRSCFVKCNS